MSDVYLSSVGIHNFRTFGDFQVVLPPAPGLLLLSGTNGLGKSSFFDAIEWALTGKIRRFTPYVSKSGKVIIPDADYLTRNGAKADSHAVTLQFSEGEAVQRSAIEIPSESDVSALLSSQGRGQVTDLGTHLAMTHFLGQAERQRFTSRDADDQWAALKGPSGVERLELIRTRLRGRSTTYAFGNRIKVEQAAVTAIEKNIADWQGWQARLDRLRSSIRASGRLTEEDVRARSLLLETELLNVAGLAPTVVVGETGVQLLARLAALLETARERIRDRTAKLAECDDLIARYEVQQALTSEDHPTLLRARQQLAEASKATADAQERSTAARDAATAQAAVIVALGGAIGLLESTRVDLLRRAELATQIETLRGELELHTTALAESQKQLADADSVISANATATNEFAQLSTTVTQVAADLETARQLTNLFANLRLQEAELATATSNAAEVQSTLDATISLRDTRLAEQTTAERERAEAERHASAIASAVASVANHIHETDEACPVCHTHFAPGQLKILASEAAKSGDARVAFMAERVEKLTTEIAVIDGQIADLAAIVGRPALLEPNVVVARESFTTLAETLRQRLKATEDDDLARLAELRNAEATAAARVSQLALADQQPAVLTAGQQRVTLSAEIERIETLISTKNTRLTAMINDHRDCSERIAARGLPEPSLEEVGGLLDVRRKELDEAQRTLTGLEGISTNAQAAASSEQEQLGIREAEYATAELSRKNAVAAAQELVKQWGDLGFASNPDRAVLETAVADANRASGGLSVLADRLRDLSRDNEDLLLDEELAAVVQQMLIAADEEGLKDPSAHLGRLQERLVSARAALKLSQDAQDAVNRYTVKLGERAEAYNREVLQPLNDRILEFNAAMLSTPGASVQFKANKRVDRTDFEMQLDYGDELENIPSAPRKVPPQVVLSEGQLAANGFSILCAASTAYRWSRWSALLLDDPLQHNDIIHAAAFVDVMRNLVELEGYQLMMSSHDRAETEFISRKFDAAGLPCTTVFLTAPSESGVLYDPPTYNVHAQRVLDRDFNGRATSA
ncbi:AAA family ATPase [Rhizobium sp. ZW T2_16]|uniref:AAA family ATPase n=1 Tax=Rhizobium sp. ZW T2_16 TaxID=3378083 RepID=UPI00385499E5